mgnify:CR=1 FL=1
MKDVVHCMMWRINAVLLAWLAFAGFAQAGGSVTGKCQIEESGTYRVKIYCESGVEPDTVRYSVPVVVAKGDSAKITVSYALVDKNAYLSGYGTANSSVDTTTFTQDGEIDLSVTAKSKTSGKIACCEYEFTIKATYTYKLSATARLSVTQNGQSAEYVDDQDTMANVTYENDGHDTLSSLAVSVDVDGRSVGKATVNSLEVGKTGSKTFNLGKLSAGTHEIRGKVGSYATVSKTITVVEGVPTLTVDSPERIMSAAGGELTFSVRGNVTWQTVPSCAWIHLTEGGRGNGVITCQVDRNSVAEAREGSFVVTGEEGVEPIDVLICQTAMTPPQTPDVTVYEDQTPDGLCFTWKEDPLALSYVIYRADSVDGTWRQIAKTEGTSYTDDDLNPGERLWYKVVAENEVGQSESACFSGENPVILDVSCSEVNLEYKGGNGEILVTCNREWSVESSAEWIVVLLAEGGRVGYSVAENLGNDPRNGWIVISSGSLSRKIDVRQNGTEMIERSFDAKGGTGEVTFTDNLVWQVTTDVDWISLNSTEFSAPGECGFEVSENFTADEMVGTITLTSGTYNRKIIVRQTGKLILSLNSGTVTINTSALAPTFAVSGGKTYYGTVVDGVAIIDFYYLELGALVNVSVVGSRPLILRSATDMKIATTLDVSGSVAGRCGGGVGGNGGVSPSGPSGGSGGWNSTSTSPSGSQYTYGYGGSGGRSGSIPFAGSYGFDGRDGEDGKSGNTGDDGDPGGYGFGNNGAKASGGSGGEGGAMGDGGSGGAGGAGRSGDEHLLHD